MNMHCKKFCITLLCMVFLAVSAFQGTAPIYAVEAAPPQAQAMYDGYETVQMMEMNRAYDYWDEDYLYTIDANEISWLESNGYRSQYQIGGFYVSPVQVAPLVPLYRLWNDSTRDHLFTIDQSEINYATSSAGFTLEGICGYVVPPGVSVPGAVPIHRRYHQPWSCHTYSMNYEHRFHHTRPGSYEGTPFQAFKIKDYDWDNPPVVGVPGQPGELKAKAISGTRVDISWTNNSRHAAGIKVLRKKHGQSSYQTIKILDSTENKFSDLTIEQGTKYTYKVVAYNAYGDSNGSNEVSVTPPATAPAAPTQLTASAVNSKSVKLIWQDNSADETAFTIERKDPGAEFCIVGTQLGNIEEYTDTNLKANTSYTYRIRAWARLIPSTASNQASVKTPGVYSLPNPPTGGNLGELNTTIILKAPTNLSAIGKTSTVILNWSDNANNETGFSIERFNGLEFEEIDTVTANIQTYTDADVQSGHTYRYRVRTLLSSKKSSPSNEDEATVLSYAQGNHPDLNTLDGITITMPLPAAPSQCKANTISGSIVNVTWTDNANNESGFELERKTAGGSYFKIADLPAGATGYLDIGISTSQINSYRIKAVNAGGSSAYSNEASSTILLNPNNRYLNINSSNQTQNGTGVTGSGSQANESSGKKTVVLSIGKTGYTVNGSSNTMDAVPVIIEGRTMLPIRAIVEALGGTVDWNAQEQKAICTLNGKTVITWVGNNTAQIGDVKSQIDPDNPLVKPIIVPPGRTLLPLRFVVESLGCNVEWNQKTQTITIIYPAS